MSHSLHDQLARQTLRQTLKGKRRALSMAQQCSASQAIILPILSQIAQHRAQHVAFYLASDGEIDPMPAMQACWQQQIQTYLPVLHPFRKGHLLFLHFTADTPMQTNRYGIQEPQLSVQRVLPLQQLHLIFTPLVGFDAQGHRLGMGGGYYDRTLALNETLPAIGLAHDCQQVAKIPTATWDQPLLQVITPENHAIVNVKSK
ncbi:5-formyltetrahydrofolate cyclo-ligase [Vibrio stylophorae]|uniref:5-formyltetrahydrofolate cyclo-ligase n=1 Tax=Vibrio stylophorae TaxID=659351 RepID=A0ABM8ZQN7_9VIBR|nr:5-formyltetrahydrofolate cyclo-ligase [Vibrio stylophorae]CAH0532618.1 5-formyltetrahydrofolate cyclo-ligase [Vibrio stylophorae]